MILKKQRSIETAISHRQLNGTLPQISSPFTFSIQRLVSAILEQIAAPPVVGIETWSRTPALSPTVGKKQKKKVARKVPCLNH